MFVIYSNGGFIKENGGTTSNANNAIQFANRNDAEWHLLLHGINGSIMKLENC